MAVNHGNFELTDKACYSWVDKKTAERVLKMMGQRLNMTSRLEIVELREVGR